MELGYLIAPLRQTGEEMQVSRLGDTPDPKLIAEPPDKLPVNPDHARRANLYVCPNCDLRTPISMVRNGKSISIIFNADQSALINTLCETLAGLYGVEDFRTNPAAALLEAARLTMLTDPAKGEAQFTVSRYCMERIHRGDLNDRLSDEDRQYLAGMAAAEDDDDEPEPEISADPVETPVPPGEITPVDVLRVERPATDDLYGGSETDTQYQE